MSPDQMLSLLPNTVLAGLLYLLVKREVSRLEKDKDEEKLERKSIKDSLSNIEKWQVDAATRPMLGAMGDRLDGRITNIAQDLAVIKDRQERVK